LITTFKVADWFFLLAYVAEILVKMNLTGFSGFFNGGGASAWNIMDFSLTVLTIADEIVQLVAPGATGSLKTLRILRVARLVRITRIFRSTVQLTVAVEGLFESFQSLGWIMLLIATVIYVFAVLLVSAIDHAVMHPDYETAINEQDEQLLYQIQQKEACQQDMYFCNVPTACLTLVDITMGALWGRVTHPIWRFQAWLLIPIVLYMVMVTFGLLNVIVGVICDSTAGVRERLRWRERFHVTETMAKNWHDAIVRKNMALSDLQVLPEEEKREKIRERRKCVHQSLQDMLESSPELFPAGTQPEQLFDTLDNNEDEWLTYEEFVLGVGRILLSDPTQHQFAALLNQGELRANLAKARRTQNDIQERMSKMENNMGRDLEKISKQLDTLLSGK